MTLARGWAMLSALALLVGCSATWACDKDQEACKPGNSCPAAGYCPKASVHIWIHPNGPCPKSAVKVKNHADCCCECEAKGCGNKGPCCDCCCECETKSCGKDLPKCCCPPGTKCVDGCTPDACPCGKDKKGCCEGCCCQDKGGSCCCQDKGEGCCCKQGKSACAAAAKKIQGLFAKFPFHGHEHGHKSFVGGCLMEVASPADFEPSANLPPPLMPLMMLLESICNGTIPPPPVPGMPVPPGVMPVGFPMPFDAECCQADKCCFSMEHKADGIYIKCPCVEECVCKKVSLCGPHGCLMLEDVKMKAGKSGSKVHIVAEKLCLDPRTGRIQLMVGPEGDSGVMPASFRIFSGCGH